MTDFTSGNGRGQKEDVQESFCQPYNLCPSTIPLWEDAEIKMFSAEGKASGGSASRSPPYGMAGGGSPNTKKIRAAGKLREGRNAAEWVKTELKLVDQLSLREFL